MAVTINGVTINGVTLSTAEHWALSLHLGTPVADGRYFYDHLSGAWGYEGGPIVGYLGPGLPLPPAAPAAPPAPSAPSAPGPRARSIAATTPASPPPPPNAAPVASAPTASDVIVNGVALDTAHLDALRRQFGAVAPPGRYWYDPHTGAWGAEGGPAAGLLAPGLALGGPLRADASGAFGTQVYVNGRELHPLEVQALAQLTPVMPGRYWMDAFGNVGIEGGPVLANLAQLARQARGGAWSHTSSATGASVGGDGNGFFYFMDKDTSYSIG